MQKKDQEQLVRDYARYLLTPHNPENEALEVEITEEQIDQLLLRPEFRLLLFAQEFYGNRKNNAAFKKWQRAKKKRRKIICQRVCDSKAFT